MCLESLVFTVWYLCLLFSLIGHELQCHFLFGEGIIGYMSICNRSVKLWTCYLVGLISRTLGAIVDSQLWRGLVKPHFKQTLFCTKWLIPRIIWAALVSSDVYLGLGTWSVIVKKMGMRCWNMSLLVSPFICRNDIIAE